MSLDTSQVKKCACANLRAATRAVTQAFDDMLAPSGLTISQFTVLTALANKGPASVSDVAGWLRMDATTLTRGLKPLIKTHLVVSTPGADQRTRQLSLTEAGRQALEQALPLWQTVQARITEGMGEDRFEAFLSDLHLVASLVR